MQIELDATAEKELEGLERAVRSMPTKVQDYMYAEMTYAAAKVFVKHAKGSPRFQNDSGRLRKSIKAVRLPAQDAGGRKIKSGKTAAVIGGKGARQGFLIEFGTQARYQSSTGRYTGRVEPRRPLDIAFETQQQQAATAGTAAAKKNFDQMAKAARKEGKLTARQRKALGG